jgi:8-oxo-dGTP pyrophosphatase MutT (NUDIX family)
VHRDGDWHGALHIWIGGVGPDGVPFALFQRRSRSKDTWPGSLDVAVGGHARAGESFAETLREAEEEIGLAVRPADLVLLGRRFARARGGAGMAVDNEVQQVYALRSDRALRDYRLHPHEVDAIVAVPLDDAVRLFAGETGAVQGSELARGAAEPVVIDITVDAFAAGEVGGYAERALRSLTGVVAGARPKTFELR